MSSKEAFSGIQTADYITLLLTLLVIHEAWVKNSTPINLSICNSYISQTRTGASQVGTFSYMCPVYSTALSHQWLGYPSCQQAPKRRLSRESLPPCAEEWLPVLVKPQAVSGVHAVCNLALILTTLKHNLQSCLYSLLSGSVFMCQLTHMNVKGDHYGKTREVTMKWLHS